MHPVLAHFPPQPRLRFGLSGLTLVASAALLLSACGQGTPGAGGPGGNMPPAEVGVVTVTPSDVGLVNELPGRLEASRVAEVRARAAGILQKRLFAEGSDVKAGQALFQIDAAPYEATLASATASLAKAEATVQQTKAQAERYKPLVEAKAISQQDYINAVVAEKQAEADVAVARAAIQTARINLGYAHVTAPISGRIGRALVTEGALVGQSEATELAVVQQTNPLYVNFTQSAAEIMALRRAMDNGQFKQAGKQAASVSVVLEDGSDYPLKGKLLFSDLTVDSTSGQLTLRAEIPNPKGTLLPGLYVRVRLEQAKAGNAIALPQQAVTRTPAGDTVMVVDAQGKATPRPVTIGAQQNGQWVILSGLQAGEQVMVDGFQKLRGGPVKAVPWQAASSAANAPAAAASEAKPASSPASAASSATH
jgi:membrane fusion protein (multidrug efflux system)